MSTNLRCTRRSCRKRHTVHAGQRIPLCPRCGAHLAEDPAPKRRTRLRTCYCDGLPYPHRRETTGCTHGELDYEAFRSHIRNLRRL